MRKFTQLVSGGLVLVASAFFGFPTTAIANGAGHAAVVDVNRGTVAFEVGTNVPALRVHGKSRAATARAMVAFHPEGVVLEQIEAIVPVHSLETGLGLRDEHMRKYIFTTDDGKVPDVRFSAERAECLKTGAGQRTSCTVSGALVIRNLARPFTITLTLCEENGNLRASGDGIVKLSTYGIEPPSQLGVRTADEVKLKLEFTAQRPAMQMAVSSRGER